MIIKDIFCVYRNIMNESPRTSGGSYWHRYTVKSSGCLVCLISLPSRFSSKIPPPIANEKDSNSQLSTKKESVLPLEICFVENANTYHIHETNGVEVKGEKYIFECFFGSYSKGFDTHNSLVCQCL